MISQIVGSLEVGEEERADSSENNQLHHQETEYASVPKSRFLSNPQELLR